MAIISAKNITKKFKTLKALDDVSLDIEKGSVYALVGINGAGKTTLLRIFANLAYPTEGAVTMDGKPVIGCLIEAPGIFPKMSAEKNIRLKCEILGKTLQDAERIIEATGVSEYRKKAAGALSLGQKQRLGIALALCGDPDVVILDEPMNGLDPMWVAKIRQLILDLRAEGKTIIISSHMLDETAKVSDRYGILKSGKLIETGRIGDLSEDGGHVVIVAKNEITVTDEMKAFFEAHGVTYTVTGCRAELLSEEELSGRDLVELFTRDGNDIESFSKQQETLEEHFIRVMEGK